MDPVSQGLLGAVTAQLGFRERIGRDTTWVAAGAAMVADLDIVILKAMQLLGLSGGDIEQLRIHRGLTHSVLAVPALALIVTILWAWAQRRFIARRKRKHPDAPHKPPAGFGWLYACIFVAMLSHPLLDWCTSYGTPLFLPLSDTRYAADCVPIIDIIYTSLLALVLLACWLARRFLHSAKAAIIVGWVGFLLSVGYLVTGRLMHNRAIDRGIAAARRQHLIPAGQTVTQADAYPAMGTIFLWRVVLQTSDEWVAMRIHLFAAANAPVRANVEPKVDSPWVRKAEQLKDVQTFIWFAMGRVRAEVARHDGVVEVNFHDMRYAWRPEGEKNLWTYRVEFDAQTGKVINSNFAHWSRQAGLRGHFLAVWNDLWNP